MQHQGVILTTQRLWVNCVLALLTGALATLSLPPFDIWPILLVSYPVLVWLLDAVVQSHFSRRGRAWSGFAVGWCFAFGYFVPSLWWISEAFWVEPEKFAALIPFAVAGLPSYLAIYWGLACAAAALLWAPGAGRIFLLAALIGTGEWLRGHLLTGFPWNLPGYGVISLDGFAQVASIFGIYGLSVLTVLLAASPAMLLRNGSIDRAGVFLVSGFAMGALAANLWGNQQIAAYSSAAGEPRQSGRLVRIVQPNIPQTEKWNPESTQAIIDKYLKMTARPFAEKLTEPPLVVWPESAIPKLLGEEDVLRAEIIASLPAGSSLLTGGLHRQTGADGTQSIYNALLAISPQGRIVARHDKVRLVPFGEFLPFGWLLEPLGLRQLVNLPPGFSPGIDERVLSVPGVPNFAGFICYEAVFPRTLPYEVRPAILVNVTNDAWFGTSGGPHQHLAHARMRSIEQGVPMLRAANTGISAVINPHGLVLRQLGLGDTGVVDAYLPEPAQATVYSQVGDYAHLVLVSLMMIVYLVCRRSKKFAQ